ncbi:MAG: hypothetical protein JWM85_3341, partial [Acidimicrobiaceae bacterium]|nr:hypothetical protein [Acidimicrobiaceae bacterium]
MSVLHWVKQHDPGLSALRRAGRTAIVMPALFAVGDKVIGNPIIGTFAAFGTFALLLLVDFPGPTRDRLSAQAALCATGAVLVCLGTLAGRASWLAAMAMAVVAFLVLFSAVISSVRAGSTTALLLSFILPVTFHGPLSSLPDRLAGWGMASAGSLLAVSLLWPAPARYPLRSSAAAACRALADRLRADVAYILSGETLLSDGEHDEIVERASEAAQALQRTFLATPYRPTGLGTAARTVVRLVDEIRWLNAIIARIDPRPTGPSASPIACPVRMAAAAVLECCADLLGSLRASADPLRHALGELRTALVEMEEKATLELPIGQFVVSGPPEIDWRVEEFVTALDPTFRSQELTFGTAQVGGNVLLASQAERRSWLDRLLGRQPEGLSRTFAAATERVASHLERHSVSLHNSLRGAVALGVAVLIANLTGVAHSFWVVLGTLAVLRSNALSTGQNIVRGILGTVVGFVIGGALVALIGTN